ncbi:ABC-type sugar transport system, ATPase component [Sphaerochaeta pleomorpha str. Grapes]|uniref:ABC-type sugar transport system, ATPase component n=1 Tax=Sphaerochaeta pleomorpha (strain ATCC BAA-1885 / DSM 22778 / Grapes) TaxID=158190 RepID=G8QU78_SPHPG|nr:sugar ABC transporter ATP-binding protein [Sphaerochaeta pleomorpha]AEV28048.1 ABC-type sugar transport system, ATPase component [Sphaerochaeta pleomorpha str. Grapes]
MPSSFLRMEGIYKDFTGVKALKNVDFEIQTGEIHCLAGENGCGKSTLIKIISGAHEASGGKIFIEGSEIHKLSPIVSIKKGIQVIYQDFAVFPNLTVSENIAMNKALMTDQKTMNWKKARSLALEAMEKIGAHMDPDMLVERLSVSNKQMVAICRAIINDAKLLILDEPTTALTFREVEMLYDVLRNLKRKGMAVVIVNHKLDEIYEIADRLTILRNGENVATGKIGEFDRNRFIQCMTGREIVDSLYEPAPSDEKILQVEHLALHGAFEDVSFILNKGDVLGITGLLGSGRSEVGDALFGISPADSGTIKLNGKEITIKSIHDATKHRIGYVPEDRLTQGLFLTRSIRDNTVAASISKYLKKGRIDTAELDEVAKHWIKKIGCVASCTEAPIKTLSGGNAQKMVIAKWMNTEPDLLILNGPTVGVDIGSKFDIHTILHELAASGVGIIIISDDLSELYYNCNKLVIMNQGKSSGLFETKTLSEEQLSTLLHGDITEMKNE